jgi:hypothetical protein
MAKRISVRLVGNLGLDDADRLMDALADTTGLSWHDETPADSGHLTGGIAELVLVAVVGRGAEMAFEGMVHKVRELVEDWKKRRLDPPQAEVEETTVPEPEPQSGPQPDGGVGEDGGRAQVSVVPAAEG